MNTIVAAVWGHWLRPVTEGWDQFWFAPQRPHTLALIRILGGAMLLYTHAVWSLDLLAFLGPDSWVPSDVVGKLSAPPGEQNFAWSYLFYVQSPALLWALHLAALVVFLMLTLGLYTRVVAVLSFLITISYCHRLAPALFGLDQVNAMLATYLMLGPSGAAYSVDSWLARQRGMVIPPRQTTTTIAIRLMQLHLCVIYLFGGITKMPGGTWWDGSALWMALANQEYRSWNMTWLVDYPWLVSLLTHVAVFWETFYPVLIWPKLTRPVFLAIAIGVHGGIALFLGMPTFGLAMLIANLAFVAPELIDAAMRRFRGAPAATSL